MDAAKLDDQLCFALYSASNQLSAIYRGLLDPIGLTYTQFLTLLALLEQDGPTISDLANRLGLSKPTMTPLLRRLEQKGFIHRMSAPDNEREKLITLTQKGHDLGPVSKEITHNAFDQTGLSNTESRALMALCSKIVDRKI